MKSLEQLGRQLASMHDLQTLVRTMKALSAASIVQYERAVVALASYVNTVELGLQVALRAASPRPETPTPKRTTAVIFGSDHGLCGRFNENVAAFALEHLAGAEVGRLIAVGARLESDLSAVGASVERVFRVPSSAGHITRTVQEILVALEDLTYEPERGRVLLFHNRTVHRQVVPKVVELLPLSEARVREFAGRPWPSRRLPTMTAEPRALLGRLLRHLFVVSLFRACAESLASEHASRLAAMQAAERNLAERVDELKAQLRWARQNTITAELLDIVSGFEATRA